MDRSLKNRKRELELECRLADNVFTAAADRFEEFMKPFLESYRRHEQRSHATTFVRGLCSDLERKNGESIAYFFGLDRKEIQHFVGESRWDDMPILEELGRQIGKHLGEPNGVLAFDPSAFPKSGKQSAGVSRQWCGRLGKVDNCQVGVFLAYVSSNGHALVDTDLYLPKEWTQDKGRMKRAGVPIDRQRYRTRHQICLELLERHGKVLPHRWITGDDELGRPAGFRKQLRDLGERYLLAVPCNTTIRDLEVPEPEYPGNGRPPKRPSMRVDKWVTDQQDDICMTVTVRDGEKGPIVVEAIKRRVETGQRHRTSAAVEMLLVIRYRDRDCHNIVKTDYYLSNAEQETTLNEFCRAAKAEHRIEECLQQSKSQAGLSDYEVRGWLGWRHHQTLSLMASWFLNVETRRAEKKNTRDHLQSSTPRHCFDSSSSLRMRFTPRRSQANRATIASESASKTVPLEKT